MKASDSSLGRIFRQTSTLGRMVDEGKRDPEWVSKVLQAAIEHREDGRKDLIQATRVIDLGEFQIDYGAQLVALTERISTQLPLDLFQLQPEPMHYHGGLWGVSLSLVHYSYNHDDTPSYHEIRALLERNGFLPVQLRELLAVLNSPGILNDLLDNASILALGHGVPVPGRVGDTPCTFECIPAGYRFFAENPWAIRTQHINRGDAGPSDYFLVRKIVSSTW